MKTYVAPKITFVNLCVEERLAGSVCQNPGTCDDVRSLSLRPPPPPISRL